MVEKNALYVLKIKNAYLDEMKWAHKYANRGEVYYANGCITNATKLAEKAGIKINEAEVEEIEKTALANSDKDFPQSDRVDCFLDGSKVVCELKLITYSDSDTTTAPLTATSSVMKWDNKLKAFVNVCAGLDFAAEKGDLDHLWQCVWTVDKVAKELAGEIINQVGIDEYKINLNKFDGNTFPLLAKAAFVTAKKYADEGEYNYVKSYINEAQACAAQAGEQIDEKEIKEILNKAVVNKIKKAMNTK